MTKRRRSSGHGVGPWLQNQLWNTSLIWLLCIFAVGAGFYYQTTGKLDQHSTALNELKAKAEETKKEDVAERAKVRDAFLADSKATAAGIAELNKQTAVMSASLGGLQRELEKIGNKLDAAPPARER